MSLPSDSWLHRNIFIYLKQTSRSVDPCSRLFQRLIPLLLLNTLVLGFTRNPGISLSRSSLMPVALIPLKIKKKKWTVQFDANSYVCTMDTYIHMITQKLDILT